MLKNYAEWNENQNKLGGQTIHGFIKSFKTFINKEIKYNYGINLNYVKFTYSYIPSTIVRLEIEEFHKFYRLKLESESQQRNRDIFCLMVAIGGIRLSSRFTIFDRPLKLFINITLLPFFLALEAISASFSLKK